MIPYLMGGMGAGDVKLAGVLLKVNAEDGSAVSIDRLMINFDLKEHQNKGNTDESNEE